MDFKFCLYQSVVLVSACISSSMLLCRSALFLKIEFILRVNKGHGETVQTLMVVFPDGCFGMRAG